MDSIFSFELGVFKFKLVDCLISDLILKWLNQYILLLFSAKFQGLYHICSNLHIDFQKYLSHFSTKLRILFIQHGLFHVSYMPSNEKSAALTVDTVYDGSSSKDFRFKSPEN